MAKKAKAPIINGAAALAKRQELGLNQQQFWSKLGVTQSGGSRYESGRDMPKPVKRLYYITFIACLPMTDAQQAAFDAIK